MIGGGGSGEGQSHAGRQDLEELTMCSSVSSPSAMLALSLGMCLQILLEDPHNPTIFSVAWTDLVFQVPSHVPSLIS